MKSQANNLLGVSLLVISVSAAVIGGCTSDDERAERAPTLAGPPAEASDLRPMFSLPGTDGRIHLVSEWDGKILAINFWATWCGPCRKEIPEFIDLQNEYGEAGVQFIGVAIDSMESVVAYAQELGINYPLLVGDDAAIAAGFAYGNEIGALPYTAIVDRNGRIVLRKQGVLPRPEAVAALEELL